MASDQTPEQRANRGQRLILRQRERIAAQAGRIARGRGDAATALREEARARRIGARRLQLAGRQGPFGNSARAGQGRRLPRNVARLDARIRGGGANLGPRLGPANPVNLRQTRQRRTRRGFNPGATGAGIQGRAGAQRNAINRALGLI